MYAEIVPQHPWHCSGLSTRLRKSDQDEVRASSGMAPLEALLESHKVSDYDMRWTALIDGRAEIMWGVANCNGIGGAWLLGSDRVSDIKRQFWTQSIEHIALMHTRYPVLTNWVAVSNIPSMTWLTGLGFHPVDFDPEYGVGKQPFLRYESCASR